MDNKETKKERKYYTAGPGKPPIFVQAILYEKKMFAIDFFHITDAYLDWERQGDDLAVLEPLIAFLAKWGDDFIFAFDDTMAELLYSLDTRKIAQSIFKGENFSADEFLYIRCVALINSKPFYNDIISGRKKLKNDLQFEPILYVPALAWARLHGKPPKEYSHSTKFCYETMSNLEGWKEVSEHDIDDFLLTTTKKKLDIKPITCKCGANEFKITLDKNQGAIQVCCNYCGEKKKLLDSEEIWSNCKPRTKKCSNCKNDTFHTRIGFERRENGSIKWVHVGALCTKCESLSLLADWKINYEPTDEMEMKL